MRPSPILNQRITPCLPDIALDLDDVIVTPDEKHESWANEPRWTLARYWSQPTNPEGGRWESVRDGLTVQEARDLAGQLDRDSAQTRRGQTSIQHHLPLLDLRRRSQQRKAAGQAGREVARPARS